MNMLWKKVQTEYCLLVIHSFPMLLHHARQTRHASKRRVEKFVKTRIANGFNFHVVRIVQNKKYKLGWLALASKWQEETSYISWCELLQVLENDTVHFLATKNLMSKILYLINIRHILNAMKASL